MICKILNFHIQVKKADVVSSIRPQLKQQQQQHKPKEERLRPSEHQLTWMVHLGCSVYKPTCFLRPFILSPVE